MRRSTAPESGSGIRELRELREGLDRDPGSISPQALEPVELAAFGGEDVNDEVDVVHQDPLAEGATLDVRGPPAGPPNDLALDVLGDGQRLPIGGAVADDEPVGDIAAATQVENQQALGLFVEGRGNTVRDLCGNLVTQRVVSCR